MRHLEGTEILYGFCSWLTSRDEETVMSGSHNAGLIVELIKQFSEANGLKCPEDGWEENLLYPIEDEIATACHAKSVGGSLPDPDPDPDPDSDGVVFFGNPIAVG